MTRTTIWRLAYYLFFAVILCTAALNMRQVRGGFWTNHAADVFVPAWLYVASRGLHSTTGRTTLIQRTIGRSPTLAGLTLFTASAVTEVSQYYWPHGMFPGRFDWYDLLSYAAGIAACFAADTFWPANG